ncbi:hypothetical protein Nepgr_003147 [Nepenthes gracilis]|uniref:Thiol-disulfide oxidoreductase DCC n=1 Tax=Nepenthes gracilis TaxID=150966 RepID=A0AAD3RYZ9_NEPGR|nr:hypothetical protein Nepgr_003147 [Nepenthes gracilis]
MALRSVIYIRRKASPSLLSATSALFRTEIANSSRQQLPGLLLPYPHGAKAGFRYSLRAINDATVEPVTLKKDDEGKYPQNWKIKMLYDGDCPLCMREVNMLRERNKQYGAIKFVDISSEDYSSEENQGLDYKTAMGRIHAILSDGRVVTDVEAFRRLYEAVDLGWVYAITKYEPIATIADAIYGFWAKYRLRITGRPPLEEILVSKGKGKGQMCNGNNTCKM